MAIENVQQLLTEQLGKNRCDVITTTAMTVNYSQFWISGIFFELYFLFRAFLDKCVGAYDFCFVFCACVVFCSVSLTHGYRRE